MNLSLVKKKKKLKKGALLISMMCRRHQTITLSEIQVLRHLKANTTEKSLLNRIKPHRLWESYNYVLGDCEHNLVRLVVKHIAFQ